jgi:hypothetical protein
MVAIKSINLKSGSIYGVADAEEILIGLAVDNARAKIAEQTVTKQTDSSTGTAHATTVGAVALPALFTVTATDASPKTGFDTAIGKLNNAFASLAEYMNPYRRALGKVNIVYPSTSTVTAAIAACDKTLTAVDGSGSSALEAVTGLNRITLARNNLATLTFAVNDMAVALGYGQLTDSSGGATNKNVVTGAPTIVNLAATATGVLGTTTGSTLSDAAVDTALTALVNGIATLSAYLDFMLDPDEDTNLTDNSSGTASTANPPVVEAMTATVVAYQDVSTASAPKAGFDTALTAIKNDFADLALKANSLIKYAGNTGISYLTDSTGGSADTTIAAINTNLTAVNGSGSTSLPYAGTSTILGKIMNNVATLTAKVNELSAWYGVIPLTDSSTGTASATSTLVLHGSTGAGVDNGAAATGIADATIDTFLLALANNVATLTARLNALDDIGGTRPLRVCAGL